MDVVGFEELKDLKMERAVQAVEPTGNWMRGAMDEWEKEERRGQSGGKSEGL